MFAFGDTHFTLINHGLQHCEIAKHIFELTMIIFVSFF